MQKARCPLDKLKTDQAAGLRQLLGQTHTGLQVITVMSGQKGAGKTLATANLAAALARAGRDVLIIDQARHGRARQRHEHRPQEEAAPRRHAHDLEAPPHREYDRDHNEPLPGPGACKARHVGPRDGSKTRGNEAADDRPLHECSGWRR